MLFEYEHYVFTLNCEFILSGVLYKRPFKQSFVCLGVILEGSFSSICGNCISKSYLPLILVWTK